MKAHNVIIISSGSGDFAASGALDKLINTIVSLKKNPVLVLGPDADDLLRTCEEIEQCDLVFDPNYAGDIFSSIKAGLHATNGAAFIVPLREEYLEPSLWPLFERALLEADKASSCHVLQPMTLSNNDPRYPHLVTAHGVQFLRTLPASTRWEETEQISFGTVPLLKALARDAS